MRQIILQQPGTFIEQEAPEPVAEEGMALVRVHRVGVCGTDLHAFAGRQPFFAYPRVLGHELGVEVVEAPGNQSGVEPGDRCAVEPYLNCGACLACLSDRPNCCQSLQVLGVHVDGGMGPMLSVPVEKLHPANALDYDQLALVETLAIGAHAVERGTPAPEEVVLVVGMGPIGLAVAQSLLALGVSPIVADINARRLEFARRHLLVDQAINLAEHDPLDALRGVNAGQLPTLVFDATGHPQSMQRAFEMVDHTGRIVFVGLVQGQIAFDDPSFHKRELTLLASRNATPATFRRLIEHIHAGRIDTTPWITHRLGLEQVPQAFAELTAQQDLLKAVIDVA